MNFTTFLNEVNDPSEFTYKGTSVSIDKNGDVTIDCDSNVRAMAVTSAINAKHLNGFSIAYVYAGNISKCHFKSDVNVKIAVTALKKALSDAPKSKLQFKLGKVSRDVVSIIGVTTDRTSDQGQEINKFVNDEFKRLGIDGFINGHQNFHDDNSRYDVMMNDISIEDIALALSHYPSKKFTFSSKASAKTPAKNTSDSLYFNADNMLKGGLDVVIHGDEGTIKGKTVEGSLEYDGDDWGLDYKVGNKTFSTDVYYIETIAGNKFNGNKEIDKFIADYFDKYGH